MPWNKRARTRRDAEIDAEKAGEDTPYPSWDALRAEDREEAPTTLLIIRDAAGAIVRQVDGETGKGLHRTAWDLRLPATEPVSLEKPDWVPPWESAPRGPLAAPGGYTVTLAKRQDGALVELSGPEPFTVRSLPQSPETSNDPAAVQAFQRKAGELYRAVQGAVRLVAEIEGRITHLKAAVPLTPAAGESDEQAIRGLAGRLAELQVALNGDRTVASRNEPVPWSVSHRAGIVYRWLLDTRSPVPAMYEESYAVAAREFAVVLDDIKTIERDLETFERRLESLRAPYTPGRVPDWQDE